MTFRGHIIKKCYFKIAQYIKIIKKLIPLIYFYIIYLCILPKKKFIKRRSLISNYKAKQNMKCLRYISKSRKLHNKLLNFIKYLF